MSGRNSQLAVLLTRCQWMLEETTYSLADDRITPEECWTLAEAVEELASALREHGADAMDNNVPFVIKPVFQTSKSEKEAEQ